MATVIDCHTKACIGYALADHLRADLVIDALQMAARNHTLADGVIFHSDRGNIPVGRSLKQPPTSGSADRSGAPGRVLITRSRNPSTRH